MLGNPIDTTGRGRWLALPDCQGIVHLTWQWSGGGSLGFLCCVNADVLSAYRFPSASCVANCVVCLGVSLQ